MEKTLFNCYVCYKTLFKYVMYVMKLSLIEKEVIWLYAEVFLFYFVFQMFEWVLIIFL